VAVPPLVGPWTASRTRSIGYNGRCRPWAPSEAPWPDPRRQARACSCCRICQTNTDQHNVSVESQTRHTQPQNHDKSRVIWRLRAPIREVWRV
jgi:hypothetical protein